MGITRAHKLDIYEREGEESRLKEDKLRQPGVAFPSASKQEHILIVRLDITPPSSVKENLDSITIVQKGLNRLCDLFERIENGDKMIDELLETGYIVPTPLSKFHFSATIGFGSGFFEKLNIPIQLRPKNLKAMPDHVGLGDIIPYSLAQTDMIVQLGAAKDFVNRWVLDSGFKPGTGFGLREPADESLNEPKGLRQESQDIMSAISGWAILTDVHSGFQRIDGRNLMGFNDGVSNPRRLTPIFEEVVWTTNDDEHNSSLAGGTYMVFQKIEHDLQQWQELGVEKQEEWVGRSKDTGLFLGTLSKWEDKQLAIDLKSKDLTIRNEAQKKWKQLFDEQTNPEKRFYDNTEFKDIARECPVWSHVRKANPRQADEVPKKLIFRRGYPYIETGADGSGRSGLLFICFQRDINNGFEFIKKMWLNNKSFPVPSLRQFNPEELAKRHRHGRFNAEELGTLLPDQRMVLGLNEPDTFEKALEETEESFHSNSRQHGSTENETQNTGREGLGGPSELGVRPGGSFIAIVPHGGGYYYIPPIRNHKISEIGQQFFEKSLHPYNRG